MRGVKGDGGSWSSLPRENKPSLFYTVATCQTTDGIHTRSTHQPDRRPGSQTTAKNKRGKKKRQTQRVKKMQRDSKTPLQLEELSPQICCPCITVVVLAAALGLEQIWPNSGWILAQFWYRSGQVCFCHPFFGEDRQSCDTQVAVDSYIAFSSCP